MSNFLSKLNIFHQDRLSELNSTAFTPLEFYEFDLNGFLIIRNFLSLEDVKKANRLIDEKYTDEARVEFPLLTLNEFFLNLMTNKRILALCDALLGKWFRFEEAYGVQSDCRANKQAWEVNLHGGPMANQGTFHYKWFGGQPHSGVVVFGINLKEVKEGDGGLVVVPGSHNQNTSITGKELHLDLLKGDFSNWPWAKNVALQPGDLVLFTEALIHGTSSWVPTDRERRIIYYRYCPGHMAWRDSSRAAAEYEKLARTDLERRLFRPPFVGWYNTEESPRWTNHYRAPTIDGNDTQEYTLDGKKK